MIDGLISGLKQRMHGAEESLKKEFSSLRTGRATAEMLNPVMVDAYGSPMPVNQVGSISVSDVRSLTIQVWDKGLVAAVEKGIREANLGFNPSVDGDLVRISVPELNEERRKEMIKVARKYAEGGRVSVRNVRRDGMESVKKAANDKEIGEDESRDISADIQQLTDDAVASIDKLLEAKEEDIMKV